LESLFINLSSTLSNGIFTYYSSSELPGEHPFNENKPKTALKYPTISHKSRCKGSSSDIFEDDPIISSKNYQRKEKIHSGEDGTGETPRNSES
jgi:hypothetical protein